jgi:hypothetical protein
MREIRQNISCVCSEFLKRWTGARRNQQYFVSKNAERLEKEIKLHIKVITKQNEIDYEISCTTGICGRPKLTFEESDERFKGRKSEEIRKIVGFTRLAHANKMSLPSAGNMDAANLVSQALETAPKGALIIRKDWDAHAKNVVVPYTHEESLSLFTEAHLTESQYTKIRIQAKEKHCNICPIYHVMKAAIEECYPPKDKIVIHESLVQVDLQALMDRTALRIIKAQKMS